MFQTFQNQAWKMHFPRASLPTSKLICKISGNTDPPDVSFSLYWLSRHPPGCPSLFLLLLSHVGICVHTGLAAHISISISYTSSKQVHITLQETAFKILQWGADGRVFVTSQSASCPRSLPAGQLHRWCVSRTSRCLGKWNFSFCQERENRKRINLYHWNQSLKKVELGGDAAQA